MTELRTPDGIIRELVEIRERTTRGIEALREAEEKSVEDKFVAEKSELVEFLEAGGTIADRQAVAKLRSLDARKTAEESKKKADYVREHLRALERAQMNVQTQARLVESMYRGAGQGER